MFFFLSKTLYYIAMPVVWLVVLLLFAVFTKNVKHSRLTLKIIAGLFIFLTNPFIINEALRAWELPPKKLAGLPVYDAGILLTGITSFEKLPYDRIYLERGADRIIHTLWLYKEKKIKKIIISGGGSGKIKPASHAEGQELKKILLQAEVPGEDILLEDKSRNTRENALFTAKLLKQHPEIKSYVVITSAFHMRRSLACFQVAGVNTAGFPVDFYANARLYRIREVIPSEEAFQKWHVLIHEIIGFIAYRIMGYC